MLLKREKRAKETKCRKRNGDENRVGVGGKTKKDYEFTAHTALITYCDEDSRCRCKNLIKNKFKTKKKEEFFSEPLQIAYVKTLFL